MSPTRLPTTGGYFIHYPLPRPLFGNRPERQRDDLVLVKGGCGSRLLRKAHQISSEGKNRAGKPLKVLSPDMRRVFGEFGGHVSIQRSPPRWVEPRFVDKAIGYVMGLE
jgi:hypothetical protein